VIWKVNSHCKKRRNRWRASFMNTYLCNPWVFTSVVACLHLTRRRPPADRLHGCPVLHQKGLTRTLWLPVLFVTSYMSLCVLIASVSLHYFFF
jgi:hypothetical protein